MKTWEMDDTDVPDPSFEASAIETGCTTVTGESDGPTADTSQATLDFMCAGSDCVRLES